MFLCQKNKVSLHKIDETMDEIQRIKQLRQELHEHNYRYYVLNQPTIGDQDFDFLMHELQDLEAKHPEMADPNSPTQRVGYPARGQRPERGVRPGDPQIPHALTRQHL